MSVIGYRLLDIGYWISVIGYRILDIGYWILAIGEDRKRVRKFRTLFLISRGIVLAFRLSPLTFNLSPYRLLLLQG